MLKMQRLLSSPSLRCAETRSRVLASREQAAAGIGPASRGCATSLDHEGSPDEAGAPDFASEEGSTSSSSDSGVKLAPFEGKVVEGGQARDIVELASFTTSSSGSVHTLLASPTGDLLEALASAPASYFDRSCSEAASLARARQDHNTVALADQKLHVCVSRAGRTQISPAPRHLGDCPKQSDLTCPIGSNAGCRRPAGNDRLVPRQGWCRDRCAQRVCSDCCRAPNWATC